jgi:hypothetical protein
MINSHTPMNAKTRAETKYAMTGIRDSGQIAEESKGLWKLSKIRPASRQK